MSFVVLHIYVDSLFVRKEGPHKVLLYGQRLKTITVAQGANAPTTPGPLSSILTAEPDGSYPNTASYVEVQWSFNSPVDLTATPLFQAFCLAPFTPTPTFTPSATSAPSTTPTITSTPVATMTPTQYPCMLWNLAYDFRNSPDQENLNSGNASAKCVCVPQL